MKITLVTPASKYSRKGNRVTALRWAGMLRRLGHRVCVRQSFDDEPTDLLIALHARRSYPSVERFRLHHLERPLFVALTGTDLYQDLPDCPDAQRSLEMATRLIVLQPAAIEALPLELRGKARVIRQSVPRRARLAWPRDDVFEVCVMGHLREVKDPFRAAKAALLLTAASKIHVTHVGAAMDAEHEALALAETQSNPRYDWIGELSRPAAMDVLGRSRVMVLSSKMEGGANVISEALAASVPILASRIDGSIGMLGADYPGFFPFGDTEALATLLHRAETDAAFYEGLVTWCDRLYSLYDPAVEREAWVSLLREL
jgi:putative glycosyltransferase (TIGR04348 family)